MNSNLFDKLKDPDYRKAFVASQMNIGIPFQIRALLRSRPGWTQATLAERARMKQPRISGLMTPGKVRPNIETLRRLAEAFDVALIVRLASFSELAKWSEEFDPESFQVPSFDQDTGFVERKPWASAHSLRRPEQAPLISRQTASSDLFETRGQIENVVMMQPSRQALAEQPSLALGCVGR